MDNFRRRLATVDQRLAAVNGRLAKEFPGYANLSNPGPLALSRVQALLGPDEVWRSIAITEAELSKRVARFRPGLDLNEFQKSLASGPCKCIPAFWGPFEIVGEGATQ